MTLNVVKVSKSKVVGRGKIKTVRAKSNWDRIINFKCNMQYLRRMELAHVQQFGINPNKEELNYVGMQILSHRVVEVVNLFLLTILRSRLKIDLRRKYLKAQNF